MMRVDLWRAAACGLAAMVTSPVLAVPSLVSHDPGAGVFQEPGATQRSPVTPREGETITLWIKVGPSFSYDEVAVYYTTDNTPPAGLLGTPGTPSTQVLRSGAGQIAFVRNEAGGFGGNDDWWRVELPAPAREYGATVRYLVSGFGPGGGELFAVDPSDGDNTFAFTTRLAWPGAGSAAGTPGAGYPPLWYWKEEAVVGNGHINVMLDQNGSVYDIYYPSVGAVNGVSTRNEGYADGGLDQFPPFLGQDQKGQMHLRQMFLGLRPTDAQGAGTTYWLTNQNGTDYADVTQTWSGDTNVVITSQRLVAQGLDIGVEQHDFSPRGISFPLNDLGAENRGLYVKRVLLTNHGAEAVELNAYLFVDWQLNGGEQFDGTFTDAGRGAMVAFDRTYRLVNSVGEYNPTTFGDYEKNASVYLAAAMKTVPTPGGAGGVPVSEFWSDTSPDQGLSWSGTKLTLAPGETRELNTLVVGGFDAFAGATGTYEAQMDAVIDWFIAGEMDALQAQTEQSWADWLAQGVGFASSDASMTELFNRGLLGTALHLDAANGGIIAGMHNGAYPYVWPRDAAWAAITLARTGHTPEAGRIFDFLRDIAFRDVEGWGRKGFWKQKYTTDGYTIWGTPQVDETSCYPWGLRYLYEVTGDLQLLQDHYDEVYEAAIASSQDSTIDNRLRYEESVDLVYSMNLWEDSFDVFNYSNASVIRGLEDAAAIAEVLDQQACPGGPGTCGYHADRALFLQRAGAIRGGLDARLAWNGENTDISQLGITYPFEIYPAGHPRAELIMDRINGVATDAFGNTQPLVQFGPGAGQPAEWLGMVDRYWGDSYWNGGPWFLTTLWYGAYYAQRADVTAGTTDIDNHLSRLQLMDDARGPMGFGAEQIASDATLLYAGQTDYRLQTAYPNAWESQSFLTDAIMLFLGYDPDAPGNTLRVRPKLPSAWSFMRYDRVEVGAHRVDVLVERDATRETHTITNTTGDALGLDTVLRLPAGETPSAVTVNGGAAAFETVFDALNAPIGVRVQTALATGPGATTTVTLSWAAVCAADVTTTGSSSGVPDGVVDVSDYSFYLTLWAGADPAADVTTTGSSNGVPDGAVDISDFSYYLTLWAAGCP